MGAGAEEPLIIQDLAALRAFADPLRHRIVGLLDEPRTVKDISARVGRPPDRLYYHLDLLERHGLIRVLEERGAERRYVVAAAAIKFDPGLAVPATELEALVSGIFDRVQREYGAVPRSGPGEPKRHMLSLRHLRLSEQQREELTRYLTELPENEAVDGSHGPCETYGVITGIWPAPDEDTG